MKSYPQNLPPGEYPFHTEHAPPAWAWPPPLRTTFSGQNTEQRARAGTSTHGHSHLQTYAVNQENNIPQTHFTFANCLEDFELPHIKGTLFITTIFITTMEHICGKANKGVTKTSASNNFMVFFFLYRLC